MGTVTVIGSSNIDCVIQSGKLPDRGETVTGGEFFQAFGGKGANQAVAAARAGSDVHFIGSVGDDSFGLQMIDNLKRDGISTDGVFVRKGAASGVACIMIDAQGENIISVASGANRLLRPDDIRKHKHCIGESDTVLIQLEIPIETAYTGIEIASEADVPVILNPAPVPPEPLEDKCLTMVSYILPNRGELELITGDAEKEVEHAVDTLMGKGIESVVVTMGNEGCYFRTGDLSGYVPAIKVESVDTVGAGDCFAGCFAAGLSDGMDIEKAVRFGTAGAALSVTKRGAQPSMPRLKETRKLLRLQKT